MLGAELVPVSSGDGRGCGSGGPARYAGEAVQGTRQGNGQGNGQGDGQGTSMMNSAWQPPAPWGVAEVGEALLGTGAFCWGLWSQGTRRYWMPITPEGGWEMGTVGGGGIQQLLGREVGPGF